MSGLPKRERCPNSLGRTNSRECPEHDVLIKPIGLRSWCLTTATCRLSWATQTRRNRATSTTSPRSPLSRKVTTSFVTTPLSSSTKRWLRTSSVDFFKSMSTTSNSCTKKVRIVTSDLKQTLSRWCGKVVLANSIFLESSSGRTQRQRAFASRWSVRVHPKHRTTTIIHPFQHNSTCKASNKRPNLTPWQTKTKIATKI